nr:histidine phosphatase family protein [Desulforamulus aquiferis]
MQANRLREELSCIRFNHICSSDLRRARQTAEIIADKHNLTPILHQELKEISLGEWEGYILKKYAASFQRNLFKGVRI